MKNHNDDALADYFSSMLNEKKPTLAIVDTPPQAEPTCLNVVPLTETLHFAEPDKQVEVVQPEQKAQLSWENIDVENEFQVLFFELSGLMFAVPLTDLGGIHHLDDSMNALFGKPDWFSGIMTHNKLLFNIVDTAKWINTGESAETLNYSHYIVLATTKWGLSCEKLIGTETLTRAQINWRESRGKRPWLAGMVKEKMCALIHAKELVKLLDSGMDIHGA